MIKVQRLSDSAVLPSKAHAGDLGYDLYASEDVWVFPDKTAVVKTGIAVQLPDGYGAFIKDRSSVSTKQNLFTVAGVIDNGYIGEVGIAIHNASEIPLQILAGTKLAQLVLVPTVDFEVVEVEQVTSTDNRGQNGFGSTGA